MTEERQEGQRARKAQDRLVAMIGDRTDVYGIGIGAGPGGTAYSLTVLVDTPPLARRIPVRVDGISVVAIPSGPVVAIQA